MCGGGSPRSSYNVAVAGASILHGGPGNIGGPAMPPSAPLASLRNPVMQDLSNLRRAAKTLNTQNRIALGVVGSVATIAIIVAIILGVRVSRCRRG